MKYYKYESFMAGECLKRYMVVKLVNGLIYKANCNDISILGVVIEDCVMGEIVNVSLLEWEDI